MRPPTATDILLRVAAIADEESGGHTAVASMREYFRTHSVDAETVVLAGEKTLGLAARDKEALDKVARAFEIKAPHQPRPPNRAKRKLIAQQNARQEQVAKANQARQIAQARARDARDIAARAQGLADEAERRSVNAARREAERVAADAAVIVAQQRAREAIEDAQSEAVEAIVAASAAQECLVLVTQAIERAQHAAEVATGIARRCV